MNYRYSFDFAPNPSFILDAWFRRAILPIGGLLSLLLILGYTAEHWIARLALPSLAIGAVLVFIGVYLFRRNIARQRISLMRDKVFHYEIDEEGIRFRNEMANGIVKWGFRGRLIPLKGFILLNSSEIGLLPLPKDLPDDILAFIREQLKRR